ncbi:MAG: hypothetical protein AB7U75_14705 [Hyphomicrobiaceae bacterium]
MSISNTDDTIAMSDLLDAIAEIEDEYNALKDAAESGEDSDLEALDEFCDTSGWTVMNDLVDEVTQSCGDWQHEVLISESYFKEYAQELAEDIGAVNRNADWPNNCIDWDAAAEQLKMDYTEVDFDGKAYWIRSC